MSRDLKDELEKLKEMPLSYGDLNSCLCGSDDLEVTEFDYPNGSLYCGIITCEKCGKEVHANSEKTADQIWNELQ